MMLVVLARFTVRFERLDTVNQLVLAVESADHGWKGMASEPKAPRAS